MSIIKFIKNNIDSIKEKLDRDEKKFELRIGNSGSLSFSFKGSGTYGNVLKVTNNTNIKAEIPKGASMTLKIMKRRSDEPYKIKELSTVIKSFKNKYIIDKYIINVLNVDLKEDLVFLEYLEGSTVDEYLKNNSVTQTELNFFLIKSLLCVKVFHNILKYGHRDIKVQNIIYNPENGIMKCIDYGFICKLKDKKCKNRYQGTGKYIHPDMNKKYLTKKRNNNFILPDTISQDLFSIVIMLLKMYVYSEQNKQIGGSSSNSVEENLETITEISSGLSNNNLIKNTRKYNESLLNILGNYESKYKYKQEGSNKREIRYKSKYNLFKKMVNYDESKINNIVIKELIKLIKKHWDFRVNNFCIDGKKNILITNFIFDTLLFNSFNSIEESPEKEKLIFDWSIIYSYNLNI